MTRADFTSRFPTLNDAMEFESQTLSVGDEFLPSAAIVVRKGGEPTPAYWDFLITQLNQTEKEKS